MFMSNRRRIGEYPVRARGIADPYQSWVESLNRDAVRNIIEKEPGLNISQIAQKLPKMREALLAQEIDRESRLPAALKESLPKLERKLPKAGDSRKTARKHAYEMLIMGRVKKIGAGYYFVPLESRVSTELIQSVNNLLTRGKPFDWNFPLAHDVAIYRIVVDPPHYHDQFAGFLNSQIPGFTSSLFFLDAILEDAVGTGCMPTGFYDSRKNAIRLDQLRKGWDNYFRDTKLIVLAFAIEPRKLLQFVESPTGRELALEMLGTRWPTIEKGAKKKLELRASLEKIRRRREADKPK